MVGLASYKTCAWFMDKTALLSSFFLTGSWYSADCGVLLFCTFEITDNLAKKVSVSRLPAIRGSSRQESLDNSRGQRLVYTLALKLQILSLHSHFRDITFYGTNQSSKSRGGMRNDGKNYFGHVSPKD